MKNKLELIQELENSIHRMFGYMNKIDEKRKLKQPVSEREKYHYIFYRGKCFGYIYILQELGEDIDFLGMKLKEYQEPPELLKE